MAQDRYLFDLDDARFVLFEQLRVQDLLELPRFGDFAVADIDMLLSEAYRFARDVISPTNRPGDEQGCRLEAGGVVVPQAFHEAYRRQCDAGWLGVTSDREYGGQGLPFVVGAAIGEMFIGANCGLSMLGGLTRGVANVIATHGTEEMKRRYARPLIEGRWQGTMCLTEPHAGTAVGDIITSASKRNGEYYVQGQKIFISGGDHDLVENVVHLVLGRLEGAPPGIKGLSLFLVPKFRLDANDQPATPNDVTCVGLEEKLGIHGSPTCAMSYGENGDCIGELVGEEHQGIAIMFELMNAARVGVGLQGVALGSWAYLAALQYARERIQGVEMKNFRLPDAPRVPIVRHPDVRRMLATMKALSEGGRALLLETAMSIDLSTHANDEKQRRRHAARVDLLTPICKAYCSDRGVEVATTALQTLGGHGYLRDYPIEQILRDVRIAPIYEGTNGIQAIDLLGRKVGQNQGALFIEYMSDLGECLQRFGDDDAVAPLARRLASYKEQLERVTMGFAAQQMSGDFDMPLLSATPYLRMFGNVIVARLLIEQAAIAGKKLDAICQENGASDAKSRQALCADNTKAQFYDNKLKTAAFFTTNILTENDGLAAAVESGDRSALEMHL